MNTTNKVQVDKSTTTAGTSTNYSCSYTKPKAEQGWECPRCGRINAPWVRQCDCSNNWGSPTINWTYPGKGSHDDWWSTHITCREADNVLNNPNYYTTSVHNETAGGSDYWNPTTKTWENVSSTQSNSTTYPPNCHTFNYSTQTKGD